MFWFHGRLTNGFIFLTFVWRNSRHLIFTRLWSNGNRGGKRYMIKESSYYNFNNICYLRVSTSCFDSTNGSWAVIVSPYSWWALAATLHGFYHTAVHGKSFMIKHNPNNTSDIVLVQVCITFTWYTLLNNHPITILTKYATYLFLLHVSVAWPSMDWSYFLHLRGAA